MSMLSEAEVFFSFDFRLMISENITRNELAGSAFDLSTGEDWLIDAKDRAQFTYLISVLSSYYLIIFIVCRILSHLLLYDNEVHVRTSPTLLAFIRSQKVSPCTSPLASRTCSDR